MCWFFFFFLILSFRQMVRRFFVWIYDIWSAFCLADAIHWRACWQSRKLLSKQSQTTECEWFINLRYSNRLIAVLFHSVCRHPTLKSHFAPLIIANYIQKWRGIFIEMARMEECTMSNTFMLFVIIQRHWLVLFFGEVPKKRNLMHEHRSAHTLTPNGLNIANFIFTTQYPHGKCFFCFIL